MNQFQHDVTLVLGDWSDDGHGKTDIVIINSNLDAKELMTAYKKASKKLKFNFINDVATEYEDSLLPREGLQTLIDNGLDLKTVFDTDYDLKEAQKVLEGKESEEDGVSLWTDSYTAIFLFIVKLGNPEFEFRFTDSEESQINIGGYGLFQ